MNTRLIWSVLCRKSSIDSDTNNISLLDVLEEVTITLPEEEKDKIVEGLKKGEKVPVYDVELVTFWENIELEDDARLIIELKTPVGEMNKVGEAPLKFKGKNRLRHRAKFPVLPVGAEGRYEFYVKVEVQDKKAETVSIVPFYVIIS